MAIFRPFRLFVFLFPLLLIGCEFSLFEGFKPQEVAPSPATPVTDSPEAPTCPAEFSLVAANATLSTSGFCVSKYEMKASLTSDGSDVFDAATTALDALTHTPESRASGVPWVKINFATARSECASLGTGYRLIKLLEWEALARNLEAQNANWSGGAVGTGLLLGGHSDGAIAADAVASGLAVTGFLLLGASTGGDGLEGTGQAGAISTDPTYLQKRKMILASGDEVWDLAGNAREWVDLDGNGSLIDYTGPGASTHLELNSTEFTNFLSTIVLTVGGAAFPLTNFGPLTSGYNHAGQNIGKFYVSSGARTGAAITRGANFSAANSPGIFAGDTDTAPTATSASVTFRCVYSD